MLPFSHLVRHEGNESLFRAIEMSSLSTALGTPLHIHVEGLRGTGKTTIMRAVRAVLPKITRIKGCPYNCIPQAPHCPLHSSLGPREVTSLGVEEVPMPFLEISHSAKIGTVVGSIDLARITDRSRPEAAILPGTIPQANRGIVFVDEINRLAEVAPELADVLLSVMGTKPGRIQIEETGLPVIEMPITVSVWAASNPDEDPGPLEDVRRQLSDRFDLAINMSRPTSVAQVLSILRKDSARHSGPDDGKFTALVASTVDQVLVPTEIEEVVARLYLDFGLESLRAVESLLHGSRMRAMILRRDRVTVSDIQDVIALALRHRVDMARLNQILQYIHGLTEKREVAGQSPEGPGKPPGSPQDGKSLDQKGDARDARVPADAISRIFSRLRDALSPGSSHKGDGQSSSPLAARGNGQRSAGDSGDAATRGGSPSASSIGDPMKSPLAAPEWMATPVSVLPLSDLIRSPEDLLR